MMKPYINIVNQSPETVEIDIEGVIGFPPGYFEEDINTTKAAVRNTLKDIANAKTREIIVNINSYGGDVNEGISIHDLLAEHRASVTTRVHGFTASAATVVAQAGDKREISANSLYLVHRASIGAMGNVHDMVQAVKDLITVDQRIISIYAKRSGKTEAEVEALMDRVNGDGEWLTAEEAKEFGLVDNIFEPMKAVAMVTGKDLAPFGLPEIPTNKIKMTIEDVKAAVQSAVDGAIERIKAAFTPSEKPIEVKILDQAEVTAKIDELAGKFSDMEALKASIGTKDQEITDLKAKLKASNDEVERLKGKPTKVEDTNDPPIDEEENLTPRQKAYTEDVKALKDNQ